MDSRYFVIEANKKNFNVLKLKEYKFVNLFIFCSFMKTDHHRCLIHFAVTSSAILDDYLIDIRDETRRWNTVQECHNLPAVL